MSNKDTGTTQGLPGPAPVRFQARQFAATRGVLTGTVTVADWPRAVESVVDPSTAISYRVEGGADEQGHPRLVIRLQGKVEVVCQRGLHPMPVTLDGRTVVLLAANERQLEAWDRDVEDAEVVLASQPLDLGVLLEDELMLSLPFAPLCDDPGCAEGARIALREAGGDGATAAQAENPFGALRGKIDAKHSN